MKTLLSTLIFPALLLSQTFTITIRVIAPPEGRADRVLYVAGNVPEFGGWSPAGAAMAKMNDSLWTLKKTFPAGTRLEYKITCGTWASEAIYIPGEIPSNVQLTVIANTGMTLHPIGWRDAMEGHGSGITGTVKYFRNIEGEGLLPRDLIVWLPPSYGTDTSKRYPVLYLHDGENIIDPMTSFGGHEWRVDEVADSLIRGGTMREIIVVGIYNTRQRPAEYAEGDTGRAYAGFVIHTVKPMIDSVFRTLPGPEHSAVMGSSMGGLASFLFVWQHPEVFSMAGCLSSAFLWDHDRILNEVRSAGSAPRNVRFYIDNGGVGPDTMLLPGSREMVSLLRAKGFVDGSNLQFFFDRNGEHNEISWSHRLWRPLLFMFGKKTNVVEDHGGIIRADAMEKRISLVFTGHEFADGGDTIAAVLKRQGITGSFFLTGDFYRNPDYTNLITRLKGDGNYLGVHSDKHLLYAPWENRDSTLVTHVEFLTDLGNAYRELAHFGVQKEDAPYFLPPYEWYNDTISAWTKEFGLQLIDFTPGTSSNADYTTPDMKNYLSSDSIFSRILRYEETHRTGLNGFILLTHIGTDPRRTDKFYDRLDALITELKKRGYSFPPLRDAIPR